MNEYKALKVTKMIHGSSRYTMVSDGSRRLVFICRRGLKPATRRKK